MAAIHSDFLDSSGSSPGQSTVPHATITLQGDKERSVAAAATTGLFFHAQPVFRLFLGPGGDRWAAGDRGRGGDW